MGWNMMERLRFKESLFVSSWPGDGSLGLEIIVEEHLIQVQLNHMILTIFHCQIFLPSHPLPTPFVISQKSQDCVCLSVNQCVVWHYQARQMCSYVRNWLEERFNILISWKCPHKDRIIWQLSVFGDICPVLTRKTVLMFVCLFVPQSPQHLI